MPKFTLRLVRSLCSSARWVPAAFASCLLFVSAARGDDPKPAAPAAAKPQAPAKKMTITKARAEGVGSLVTVEGTVSVAPGLFSSALEDQGFALQEGESGVYVKLAEKQSFSTGAQVRVTGTVDEQNKLRVLKADPAGVTVLKGEKKVAPKKVSTGSVKEPVEGLLIQVSGKITQTFKDDSPYGYKLYVDDGSGEVQIFVHVSAGFEKAALEKLAAGAQLEVVGFAAQYEATYEVCPRSPADLVVK
jgi:DNA/RNA endonuclease YhcR with UshA esterase domain